MQVEEQLYSFHAGSFAIAVVLHGLVSTLVGLLYGAMLPMLPRRPILLGGLIAPMLWTGLLYSILGLLNHGVTPVVHEYGSLGASGDLATLASSALVLIGEGAARLADGSPVDGAAGLAACGLAPIALRAKEGLALINGTDGMLGMLVLALADLDVLLRVADVHNVAMATNLASAECLVRALTPEAITVGRN